jgi:class 3 adenylate cyclase/predicted ATPase
MGRPAMSAKIAAMSDRGDEPAASRARRGAAGTAAASEQERRYLTVVFCDLVDSTVLAGDLDPEDLEELYAAYTATVRRVIEAFGGFITRTIGDGVVAVFGHPTVHEDDAERAVRAGLALTAEVPEIRLAQDVRLSVRIGIATGLTLVGRDQAGVSDLFGATPNLAARLQTLAPINTVVVCASTRDLLGGGFVYEDFGHQALKGFKEPAQVWRVLHPTPGGSRFAARIRGRLPPLVGREAALQRLQAAWDAARQGQGRSLVIAGEPGMGKSRLVHALADPLPDDNARVVQLNCSPLFGGSALHPVAEHLQFAAGVGKEETPEERYRKLAAYLGEVATLDRADAEFAARRLSQNAAAPADGRVDGDAMRRLAAILTDLVVAWSRQRPTLVVLEDAHWADPTTLDLVEALDRRLTDAAILLIVTVRPDGLEALAGLAGAEQVRLDRFTDAQATVLLDGLAGKAKLSDELRHAIIERSDGVPLFVEELAANLLSTGQVSLPSTLEGALLARLGSALKEREIAQAASVIGRSFDLDIVALVAGLPLPKVSVAVGHLVANGLVSVLEGMPDAGGYVFRHALLEQAVYESIPRKRRRTLHGRAAEAIPLMRPQAARRFPEIIAEHLTRADRPLEAAEQWLVAGRRAAEISAVREAEQHLMRGLALVPAIADPTAGLEAELGLQLALGPILMATRGPASEEVERTYARAQALAPRRFEALWGRWRIETDNERQMALARELLSVAESPGDVDLRLQAHHALWASCLNAGDLAQCLGHIEAGLALYDPARHLAQAGHFGGHDAACCGHGVAGLACWALGDTQAALASAARAVALATELGHALSRAHALDFALLLAQHCGDAGEVARMAGDLAALAGDKGLPHYLARARIYRGWALASERDGRGVAEMQQGLADLRGIGQEEDFAVFLTLLAEGLATEERFAEALACLAEIGDAAERRSAVRYWDTEVLRLEAVLRQRLGQPEAARAALERGLSLARAMGCPMPGLRAASCLADLHEEAGRAAEAHHVLSEALGLLPATAGGHDVDAARGRAARFAGTKSV